jgi:hypothetical protein
MSLLQWLCFFLQRTSKPDQMYVEDEDYSEEQDYSEPGYFLFDEDTGHIHRL